MSRHQSKERYSRGGKGIIKGRLYLKRRRRRRGATLGWRTRRSRHDGSRQNGRRLRREGTRLAGGRRARKAAGFPANNAKWCICQGEFVHRRDARPAPPPARQTHSKNISVLIVSFTQSHLCTAYA